MTATITTNSTSQMERATAAPSSPASPPPTNPNSRLKVFSEMIASVVVASTYKVITNDADQLYSHIGPDQQGYAVFLTELDFEHMDEQSRADVIPLPVITSSRLATHTTGQTPLPLFEAIVMAAREAMTTWLYEQRNRIELI